jgi:hypothetical protein
VIGEAGTSGSEFQLLVEAVEIVEGIIQPLQVEADITAQSMLGAGPAIRPLA